MRHNNLIPTGKSYSELGFIEAVMGLYDEPLRFSFRPLLPEEQADHFEKVQKLTGRAKQRRAEAHLTASRLVKWDQKDGHGDAVEPTPVNVLSLKPVLMNRLYGIVAGLDASDIDPEWALEDKTEIQDAEYASALTGKPVSEVLLEGREKNSESD